MQTRNVTGLISYTKNYAKVSINKCIIFILEKIINFRDLIYEGRGEEDQFLDAVSFKQ